MSAVSDSVRERLRLIEDLKFFLATAPANWQDNQVIRRYYLNLDEGFVSCVFWNNLYFITGTDIVRCIVYKFEHFGRKIIDRKKFEEGVFLDLRNLKCGSDAILEPPRLEFLEFLFKNLCLRTQKKQKVFFWFNVPHDKLMADALERDLKKEKLGQQPTTIAHTEPALLFQYDESKLLYSQLQSHIDTQQMLGDAEAASEAAAAAAAAAATTTTSTAPGIATGTAVATTTNDDDDVVHVTATSDTVIKKLPPEYHLIVPTTRTPPPRPDDDDDDEFPLDYLQQHDADQVISLDSNQHVAYGSLLDDNDYDLFVDTLVFTQQPGSTGSSVSQPVVYTDEYLIEQAQPLKPPMSRADDGYIIPPQPPMLATYAPQPQYYVPMSTPGHQRYPPPPPLASTNGPPPPLLAVNQYYGGTPYYPVPEPAYVTHDQEYWPPQPGYEYPPGGYSFPGEEYPGAGYLGPVAPPPGTYYPRPHPNYTKKRLAPPQRMVVAGGVNKPPHNSRRPPPPSAAAAAAVYTMDGSRLGPKPEL